MNMVTFKNLMSSNTICLFIFVFSLSFTSQASASTEVVVCGNSNWGGINTNNLAKARTKLTDANNFGPSGVYGDYQFSFVTVGTPTTENLAANSCDVWFSGYDPGTPYTALTTFIADGGFVIGGCDSVNNDAVCEGLGLPVNGYSNIPGEYTITSPENMLTCDGDTVNNDMVLTTAGGASGYFTGGIALGQYSDGSELPLIVTDSLTQPTFLLTADIDMFTGFNPEITGGGTVSTDQDKFVMNAFKLAADGISGATAANSGGASCEDISIKSFSVKKVADKKTISSATEINYTITLANTGEVTLTNVQPVDTLPNGEKGKLSAVSGDTNNNAQLEVGEVWTYSISYNVTEEVIAAGGEIINTVMVSTNEVDAVTAKAVTEINLLPSVSHGMLQAITPANQSSYIVSGICGKNGNTVVVSLYDSVSNQADTKVECKDGEFSAMLNASKLIDGEIKVVSTINDGKNPEVNDADPAIKDTTGPAAPIVTIIEDKNNDGIISGAELEGEVDITIELPGDAVSGDVLVYTINGTDNKVEVTDAMRKEGGLKLSTATDKGIKVVAYLVDAIGNIGNEGNDTATLDTEANISSTTEKATTDSTPLLTGTTDVEDGQTVTVVDLKGTVICKTEAKQGEWQCTASELGHGLMTLIAMTVDEAGNTAETTFEINVDLEAPVVTVDEPVFVNQNNAESYSVSGTCEAKEGDVTVIVAGATPERQSTSCSKDGSWTATVDVSAIMDGVEAVVVLAQQQDEYGQVGKAQANADKDTVVPVANDDQVSLVENAAITMIVATNNDELLDNASVTSIDATQAQGEVSLNKDGSFNYTPVADFVGEDAFTYTICDDDMPASCASATVTLTILTDTDADGIANLVDRDDDNDGITDLVEGAGTDYSIDSNNNQILDYQDAVLIECEDLDPMDKVCDRLSLLIDRDQDGQPNHLDLDSDNDGLPDLLEGNDANHDGIADSFAANNDTDLDGLDDAFDADCTEIKTECAVTGATVPTQDTDQDGTPDFLDTDSDGDSITDDLEAGDNSPVLDSDEDGTPDYLDTDSDSDGISDADEAGNDPTTPTDTDQDGQPDYRDQDSDGDQTPDSQEYGSNEQTAIDSDDDGQPDYLDNDSDNDGIPDLVEGYNDTDLDGLVDAHDLDSDNDGIPDLLEVGAEASMPVDTDRDGLPDFQDRDSDNDGIPDALEAPLGISPSDSDLDGIADYLDLDSDNDGMPDSVEDRLQLGTDADADGIDDAYDVDMTNGQDMNNDGVDDAASLNDFDYDGVADMHDLDSDNDGLADYMEADTSGNDLDNDGIDDTYDVDVTGGVDLNGDGIDDQVRPTNTDGADGPDYLDLDSDNDSLSDVLESGGMDMDADGVTESDEMTAVFIDTDADGIPDHRDLDSNGDGRKDIQNTLFGELDRDNDGVVDQVTDADNDGIADSVDGMVGLYGMGAGGDTDGDGVLDAIDLDLDNDGIPNDVEGFGDSDLDGISDALDTDSDNDGLCDAFEGAVIAGLDINNDCVIDNFIDADADGLDDSVTLPMSPTDTDADATPNYLDSDSDNDGLADEIEDDDYDGNGVHDSIEKNGDGLNTNIGIGTSGGESAGSGGSFGGLWLMVMMALFYARYMTRRAGKSIIAVIAMALVSLTSVHASECDSQDDFDLNCVYLGIGIVGSNLDPEGNDNGWHSDGNGTSDLGYKITAGANLSQNIFAEIAYIDLGEAELVNYNPNLQGNAWISYQTASAAVGYYLFSDTFEDKKWHPYSQIGVTRLQHQSSSNVQYKDLSDIQFSLGLGVELNLDDSDWFARVNATYISDDAVAVGLEFGYGFNR